MHVCALQWQRVIPHTVSLRPYPSHRIPQTISLRPYPSDRIPQTYPCPLRVSLCSRHVRARAPFGRDPTLDYDYASSDDWEEEPEGEDLEGDEGLGGRGGAEEDDTSMAEGG